MKTWVRKTLSVGVLAAGALLFAPGAAHADVQSNGDNVGLLNGTQLAVPVSVPVNISGNSLGILGVADSRSVAGNVIEHGRRGGDVQSNGDNVGILNGTQAYLPVNVPVNVTGNSLAVLGAAQSNSVGVNSINGRKAESAKKTEHGDWDGSVQSNGDNVGILNGTQLYAPISVPINACGNSIAVLGGAFNQSICANNVFASRGGKWRKGESAKTEHGRRNVQSNGDNVGLLNGTQLYAPISLPVNLSGNSIAVLGAAGTRSVAANQVHTEGGKVRRGGDRDGSLQSNGDNIGIGNGTQVALPVNIPINACGNSLSLLGIASSNSACVNNIGDFGDDSWGRDRDRDRDHDGHGPGRGHDDDDDNAGNNGDDDTDYLGDTGEEPDTTDDGYPATGEEPAGNDDGYPTGEEPATNGSPTKSKGGRGGDKTEAGPVAGITETVSGVSNNAGLGQLGLLNTLR